METEPYQIHLVEPDVIERNRLKALVQKSVGGEVWSVASSLEQAKRQLSRGNAPDLVLVSGRYDINMVYALKALTKDSVKFLLMIRRDSYVVNFPLKIDGGIFVPESVEDFEGVYEFLGKVPEESEKPAVSDKFIDTLCRELSRTLDRGREPVQKMIAESRAVLESLDEKETAYFYEALTAYFC